MSAPMIASSVVVEGNWLARCEEIGKVELDYAFGGKLRRASIEMGRWGHAHVRFWGEGPDIETACRLAFEKAWPFAKFIPHPKDC